MARFKVEYSYGKKPAEGSVMGPFGSHDNVIYQWKNDELEFPDENSAMAFFNKIVNSWENEEIYEKDRLGKLHYRDVVVKAFQEGKWVPVKSANYEQWFKANKERKFAEKAKQQQPADTDNNVMENKKNMKKQIKLKENELRKIVENNVRGMLKEMFEGTSQPGSISHGTMRPIDLIPTFMNILKKEAPQRAQEILQNYPDLDEALTALEGGVEDEAYFDSEEAVEVLNNEIWDAMQEIAPEGHYFGSHPGDGSDYGYWSSDDEEPALTVDDKELYENKNPLKESQFRKIVENKVRGMLREMFENSVNEEIDMGQVPSVQDIVDMHSSRNTMEINPEAQGLYQRIQNIRKHFDEIDKFGEDVSQAVEQKLHELVAQYRQLTGK